MRFQARVRDVGGSFIITIPKEVADKLKLKKDSIEEFDINKEV